ncbi:ribokinase [Gymnodinialimonas ceratoperidinii]|uniref:Ribokinase n=1 Tax=Gymnodinialimonas ceratoperidinii TaxID=2856823 RepID=A0A8F6TZ07_9RHOB|nr:ribokinase [Gymnodinialimonas ceratoperidinii]QXT40321.1 ribokinase [Gymnodinialimonas ceratoperidinii]
MKDIIILGVFVADAAYRCARLPVVGETLLGTSFQLGPGGKGSNQAVAAAKAGGQVSFISRIGADTFGRIGRDVWAEAGVHPLVTEDAEVPTGSAGIFIEEASGHNAIIIAPGASGHLCAADVDARRDEIAGARIALTQLEQPMEAALRFLQLARENRTTTILNPAPAADLPDEMLALCDYITPNEPETEALTGLPVTSLEEATAAAKHLLAKGVSKGVLITLGENGSLFVDESRAIHTKPMNAGPVVDTTGAGDAFNGGFVTALAEGAAIEDALRFATATAALCVTKHGTAASMAPRDQIDALLASASSDVSISWM